MNIYICIYMFICMYHMYGVGRNTNILPTKADVVVVADVMLVGPFQGLDMGGDQGRDFHTPINHILSISFLSVKLRWVGRWF